MRSLSQLAPITALLAAMAVAPQALSELKPESGKVVTLGAPQPHWVWVNDIVFNHMEAGKSYLIDGASGKFLGMLSMGFGNGVLAIPKDYSRIYSAETYFSRGTRGKRTDVVTVYDTAKLEPLGEIEIPAKRGQSVPTLWHSTLTDDDRFMLVYNFNPAQSITVVDVKAGKFIGEIETPGCALAIPSGPRRFHQICGDGGLMTIRLDEAGKAIDKARTPPFFNVHRDFVTEKPVRYRDRILFATEDSYVQPVDVSGDVPKIKKRWSMLTDADRKENWRIGGTQHFAVHARSGRLFAIMHQGGIDTYKDPGLEVWVFDIKQKARLQRIKMKNITGAIQVTQDDKPLLFAAFLGASGLDMYDANSGQFRQSVPEVGLSPSVLQTPGGR